MTPSDQNGELCRRLREAAARLHQWDEDGIAVRVNEAATLIEQQATRIAELQELVRSQEEIAHVHSIGEQNNSLRERIAELERDAGRLDWIERWLFERKWSGTLGQPSDWYVASNYRHIVHKMKGETLRAAIDAAKDKSHVN